MRRYNFCFEFVEFVRSVRFEIVHFERNLVVEVFVKIKQVNELCGLFIIYFPNFPIVIVFKLIKKELSVPEYFIEVV